MSKLTKIKESIEKLPSHVEKTIEKIRCNPKTTTAATAMQFTGSLLSTLSKIGIPVVGYVAGALTIGSGILDPKPKLSDLRKKSDELKAEMESCSESVKEAIRNEVERVEAEVKKEMNLLLKSQKNEIQSVFKETLTEEMVSLEEKLKDTKEIIQLTYEVVLDTRYRQAIEYVESAYQNFIEGSHDLESTLELYSSNIINLQTLAINSLSPSKVESYLIALIKSQGLDIAIAAFNYILVVRSKYLQLICTFYMYKNDHIRVEKEYSCFNQHYTEYMKIYENLVNQKEISHDDCPKTEQKLIKPDQEEHTSNTQQEKPQNVQCYDQNLARIEDQPTMKKSTSNFEMKTLGNVECNKDVGSLSSQVSLEEQNKKSCNWKYVLAFFILIVIIAGSVVGIFLGTACKSGYYGFPNCKGKI